mmetsp:Transcript_20367/g.31812  ORF Transcript_20367/g.31812 Transcript_20367/m.31812 type:complete len:178 (+) Transcript_20367:163-696(+)
MLVRGRSGGLQVKEVTAGAAAHRSGQIHAGDYLLAVEGEGVTGMAMDQVAKLVAGAKETISLEFNRVNPADPRSSSKFHVILSLSPNVQSPARSEQSTPRPARQAADAPAKNTPTKSPESQGSLLSGLILPPSSPREAFESANIGLQNLFRHSRDPSPASGRNSRPESPSILDLFAL